MTVEIFTGSPEDLKLRLDTLIGGASVINNVIVSHQKGTYIILFT